ncbi:MAG: hypothetical protein IPL38_16445 [Rhodobacter sp.]|jgi:hypothetical protein|nr:hypothetical protein [Rhodobacter sp.]
MNKAAILFAAVLAFAISPLIVDPFTGYDPSAFPVLIERHPIQPAGWAFSIWGLIYVWLVAHGLFGILKRPEDAAWDAPRLPLTLAALIGAVWMPIAAMSPSWGTATIWPMAIAAIVAFLRCDTSRDPWLLAAPVAVLAGWLTAAASVSTGILLAGQGAMSPFAAAIAMLGLVLVIAVPVQRRRPRMPAYGLTVLWALVGVIAANLADARTVAILAALGAAIMAAALVWPRRA